MKDKLRTYYQNLRKNIINKKNTLEVQKNLYNNKRFINSYKVLIYVSNKEEIDTYEIIKKCFILKKEVYVPKCIDNNIYFYKINNLNELVLGSFNIYEPTTNILFNNEDSICIIPGIAFDKNLYRIGYGRGFYDRFLANYKGYKIGLTLDELIIDNVYPNE